MRLAELRSAEANFAGRDEILAVLPIGAVEQHSRHLPLGTDALIAEMIAAAVEQRLESRVVLLPTVSVGASDHHLSMAGTVSIGTLAIAQAVAGQCLSLAQSSGIRRFLIVNGHGGNQPAARLALETIRASSDSVHAFAVDYWAPMFAELDAAGILRPSAMGHADLIETSILLATRPELVRMELALEDAYQDALPDYATTTRGIPERTLHGGVGDPTGATAAMGKQFLDAAVRGIVTLIQ